MVQNAAMAPIRGRIEASRISLEISPSRAPYQGVATLRHWLLSLLTEPRPLRLADLDRGTVVEVIGPLAALDRLEDWLGDAPSRTASFVDGTAMFADEHGVGPLDAAALERFGIHPDADYAAAAFLARDMRVVVILAEASRLMCSLERSVVRLAQSSMPPPTLRSAASRCGSRSGGAVLGFESVTPTV